MKPSDLWQAIWFSLGIASSATAVVILVGVPLAFLMARRRFVGKSLLDGLIMMPLVLPPTVVGYIIIILMGKHGLLGRWLDQAFGYSILFRFEGAVLSAAVVALPMIYMPAKAAFASVEREWEDQARSMGANRLQLFWHVSIPLARRGLLSGVILAFARALGEFGATAMVLGIVPGRTTLPILIYLDFEDLRLTAASGAVILLSVLSLVLVMSYNALGVWRRE